MSVGLTLQGIDSFQTFQRVSKRTLQWPIQLLVRIQAQDPIAGSFLDRGILLRGVAFPGFHEDSRTKRLRNLHGAVCGT